MAFRGTFDYSLDAKNRLTIPAKFRAALSEGVVLAKGIERCVQVWTPKAFDEYVTTALAGLNPLSEPARKLNRYFAANSLDTERGAWADYNTALTDQLPDIAAGFGHPA